jgi:phosphoesterase RecJ-like protein
MLSVDASDEERTGEAGAYGRAHSQTVINLDHHATNTGFGQIHLVSPQAASATEVIYEWFTRVGVPIDIDAAVPLMTGLITDTLGFRTSATTPRTLEIAQELMRRGASLTDLFARTLETMVYTTLKLWTRALNNLSLEHGVAWVSLTLDDYERAGTEEDSGLSGFLVHIKEAVVSVVFTEKPEGKVNISMRAKRGYDVAQVALALGGGGHKPAAGATVSGTLDEVRARVLPMLFDVVQQGNPN